MKEDKNLGTKGKPGAIRTGRVDRLSKQIEVFIQAIVSGDNQKEAYLKAYPKKASWKNTSLNVASCNLFRKPIVQQRFKEAIEAMRKHEQDKTLWVREEAITNLRFIIDENKKEVERLNKSYEEEMDLIAKEIENTTDIEVIKKMQLKIISKNKQKRLSSTYNQGITMAIAELNKMSGFYNDNSGVDKTVKFLNEDKVPE